MKTLITTLLFPSFYLLVLTLTFGQSGKKGVITKSSKETIISVQFHSLDRGERPVSAQAFLKTYLEVDDDDHFKKSALNGAEVTSVTTSKQSLNIHNPFIYRYLLNQII